MIAEVTLHKTMRLIRPSLSQMSVPSWAQQSMSYMLNQVECITFRSVCLSEYHEGHQISVGSDKTSLLSCLDYRNHHYQRRLLRRWFGIQRWDSRFPTAPTLRTTHSPVTPWLTVVSSNQCTIPKDWVSFIFLFKPAQWKMKTIADEETSLFHTLLLSFFSSGS